MDGADSKLMQPGVEVLSHIHGLCEVLRPDIERLLAHRVGLVVLGCCFCETLPPFGYSYKLVGR